MKRRQHYKFISSIRSRALPAHGSCSGRLAWLEGGAASRRPFVRPIGKTGPAPHPPQKYFLSGARQLGRIIWGGFHVAGQGTFWDSRETSKDTFSPWPQTILCPRPPKAEATVARAEFTDLWNNPASDFSKAEHDRESRCYMAGNNPAVLTVHANRFPNKWVSYTFIATPRHSYSF